MNFHPLYLYLLERQPPLYVEALTQIGQEIVTEDQAPVVTSYLVAGRDEKARKWCRLMLRALKPESPPAESRYSELSGNPIRAKNLRRLGTPVLFHENMHGRQRKQHKDNWAAQETSYLALLIEGAAGRALGFLGFAVSLHADATQKHYRDTCVQLVIELDQAWIRPRNRGFGWSYMLQDIVAEVTHSTLATADERVTWLNKKKFSLRLVIGADLHSISGGIFLDGTVRSVTEILEGAEFKHFALGKTEVEGRW